QHGESFVLLRRLRPSPQPPPRVRGEGVPTDAPGVNRTDAPATSPADAPTTVPLPARGERVPDRAGEGCCFILMLPRDRSCAFLVDHVAVREALERERGVELVR